MNLLLGLVVLGRDSAGGVLASAANGGPVDAMLAFGRMGRANATDTSTEAYQKVDCEEERIDELERLLFYTFWGSLDFSSRQPRRMHLRTPCIVSLLYCYLVSNRISLTIIVLILTRSEGCRHKLHRLILISQLHPSGAYDMATMVGT